MTDIVDRATRSRWMSGIRGRNTKPELVVRSFLHGAGLRFRIHARDLPGRPDIVLPKWGAVILVHGCFWHRHPNCNFCYFPKSRPEFWVRKFEENVERDARTFMALGELGWAVHVIWECEVNETGLRNLLREITG